jgi:hypothetical protein
LGEKAAETLANFGANAPLSHVEENPLEGSKPSRLGTVKKSQKLTNNEVDSVCLIDTFKNH